MFEEFESHINLSCNETVLFIYKKDFEPRVSDLYGYNFIIYILYSYLITFNQEVLKNYLRKKAFEH